MSSNNNDKAFADRRRQGYRRSIYDLSRIGPDRRQRRDRRNNNRQYGDNDWWLQVDYFDGCYRIRPGINNSGDIFNCADNLQKL